MPEVYRITPALKDYLWGGQRLAEYGKGDGERIAESWELSFTKGGEARIADGRTLEEAFPRESWGTACSGFEDFPVLTKFIDARENLSVQVHPSDEYALAKEGQYGKTEMWYVVDAKEGAGLYLGLKEKNSLQKVRDSALDGSIEQLLSFKEVRKGDVFFIPAGTIHAIGAGVLIYEIQQNSTLTYRLYDYMRRDKDGNQRELHLDKAVEVLNPDVYEPPTRAENNQCIIGKCKYFTARKYKQNFTNYPFFANTESYLFISVISGEGAIGAESAKMGDSFFIPAGAGEITVNGDMELIVVSAV